MDFLKNEGIGTGIHYPIPLHLQRAYRVLNYLPGDFPKAEQAAAQIVSLPMFPTLTPEQQACVVHQVRHFQEAKTKTALNAALQLETAGRTS